MQVNSPHTRDEVYIPFPHYIFCFFFFFQIHVPAPRRLRRQLREDLLHHVPANGVQRDSDALLQANGPGLQRRQLSRVGGGRDLQNGLRVRV